MCVCVEIRNIIEKSQCILSRCVMMAVARDAWNLGITLKLRITHTHTAPN